MTQAEPATPPRLSCTAFDRDRRIASGAYGAVARALNAYASEHPSAQVLVFDDATGKQIDLDLRVLDAAITPPEAGPAPAAPEAPRAPGRPKLGVVAREVTLLPRHWEWLAAQPGGASATLRRLVEEARRAALSDKARLRRLHERTYSFMSAMAGNFANFEEASRALFANDMPRFKALVAGWPADVRSYLARLQEDQPSHPRGVQIDGG